MSRLLLLCYIFLIIWSVKESASLEPWQWYSREVGFSNWRNCPQLDYSSNSVVSNWYSGGNAKRFRYENKAEIDMRLARGDTLLIGTDYYQLFPITLPLDLPPETMQYLADGGVVIVRLTK